MSEPKYFRLSSDQIALYFYVYGAPRALLNMPTRVDFEEPVDEEKALEAIKLTVKRLPFCTLRMTEYEKDKFWQYYSDEEPAGIELVDFSDKTEEDVDKYLLKKARDPLPNNYNDVQLYDAKLLRRPGGKHTLFFNGYHMIMDSVGLITPKRISTMRRIGKSMAQTLSRKEERISLNGAGLSCSGLYPKRRALQVVASIRSTHIRIPGTQPAMNRRPMDTSPTVPKMIRPMLGGMVATIRPESPLMAAAQPLEYPKRSISGPRIRVSMAASAAAEPETPPISVLSRQETCPMLPHICPVQALQKRVSRLVIPQEFIRLPARIKSGIASMVKLWEVEIDF